MSSADARATTDLAREPVAPLHPAAALAALAEELREEGDVVAPHVVEPDATPALGLLVAAGPRCADSGAAYATVVESVREGYLLHYGEPRLLPDLDPDLRLLIGDHLYARGIERLALLGDLVAVAELADLISLTAQLHARSGSHGAAAEAAWLAAVVVIAAGPDERLKAAKARLREAGDAKPLWRATELAGERCGISEALAGAVETVGFSPSHLG